MKSVVYFFFTLFLFVTTSLLLTQNYWPQMFSVQDPIDPDNLIEKFSTSTTGIFDNKQVPVPKYSYSNPLILGDQSDDHVQKRIEVDLTTQRLYAYENDALIFNFIVSTGKWDRTPTGTYKIWTKIRSQKMSGGSKELGTYYYLPNVPFILFFYNEKVPKSVGYSIHGTYWHNNFGVPMSHGCVNMKTTEVEQIFNWADHNTPITIYGKYETKLPDANLNPKYSTLISKI